jgi:hypothetical protein
MKGIFALTGKRIATGWGCIKFSRWPNIGNDWPPKPPQPDAELDRIASYKCMRSYYAVRNLNDARVALSRGYLFGLTVPITKEWYSSIDGVIPVLLSVRAETFIETHM